MVRSTLSNLKAMGYEKELEYLATDPDTKNGIKQHDFVVDDKLLTDDRICHLSIPSNTAANAWK